MAKPATPAKRSGSRMSGWRGAMLATATLAACLVAFWWACTRWIAVPQPSRLSQLDDAELAPRLRALAREGPAGLAVVVESLGANREALQAAALGVLHEEIDRCAQSPIRKMALQVDRLAGMLASRVPRFDSAALARAAEIADRLIAMPPSETHQSQRLRDCHIVLAAAARQRIHDAERAAHATKSTSTGAEYPAQTRLPLSADAGLAHAPIAGGGLPIARAETRPLELSDRLVATAKPLRVAETAHHATTKALRFTSPGNKPEQNSASIPVKTTATNNGFEGKSFKGAHPIQSAGAESIATADSHEAAIAPPADLQKLLDIDKRRRSDNETDNLAADAELKRLGIDEFQLRLARGAVHADPKVRQEVVEALPVVDAVNTRAWLVWLSFDRSAEVRRAAISLLATSSDPELKNRVRQAAETDADPRIRQQARAALDLDSKRR